MIVLNNPFIVNIINIDNIFKFSNKKLVQYLTDLGLTDNLFDFSNKDNKVLYTHFFIHTLCDEIKNIDIKSKLIYYNNTLTKDSFRNSLIKKIKQIFGIKIYDGIWELNDFVEMLKRKEVSVYDSFEKLYNCDCKPKSLKHIRKFLEKEGLRFLNETYFQEIANKMTILC